VQIRAVQFVKRVAFTLAGVTLLLSALTFVVDPWNHFVSLSSHVHIGVWRIRGDSLGRVMFFSDAHYGPYRGSLIDLEYGDVVVSPFDRRVEWGDTCGIYYRWFHRTDGKTLWTLALSLWYPLVAFIVTGAFLARYQRRAFASGGLHCM
jgi:hypothetical protein